MSKPLVIGTELVSVEVSDHEQRIIEAWGREHFDDLARRLQGTGLDAASILVPRYRRMVYENDEEVVQAAIDSGLARSSAPGDES